MSKLRKIIVNATSEMLDEPDTNGIYKTTRFYNRLEREVTEYMEAQKVYRILESGTRIRGKLGTHERTWSDKHEATVVGFRYKDDGSIEYKVRCWRQNQHWWPADNIEPIPDSELCSSCRRMKSCNCDHKCGCCNG